MINVLSMGAKTMQRGELPEHVDARTNVGDRWQGIPHRELADRTIKAVEDFGIEVTKETWVLDAKGWCLTGGLQLALPRKLKIGKIKGGTYALGLMHSNDGRRALRVAAGAQVMVCQNGILTGEYIVHRKHTTGFHLQEELDGAIERLIPELAKTNDFIDQLQKQTFVPAQVDERMMEIGRLGLLPWSHVGKMDKEYRAPRHEVFEQYEGTAYGVYSAFNQTLQSSSADRQVRGLSRVKELLLPA
jgi:hypothetical protein